MRAPVAARAQQPSKVTITEEERQTVRQALSAGATALPLLLASPAFAQGGALGILEGRTGALVHPVMMGTLFLLTLYAGYTGYQWRHAREIGDQVKALKATLPAADETGNRPKSAADDTIAALEKERKEIIASGPRDKHWNAGSILLGAGVLLSVEGCVNTYIRAGKLFPGPHLFAGAAITVLWALAAACVPAMQKGDDKARLAHIGFNALNVGLFLWQVPTGLGIVEKVFEFTSWP